MSTIGLPRASPELLQRWRRQVSGQRRRRDERGPRPWTAISYLAHGPIYKGLIDVRRLVFAVLRDEQRPDESLATRFMGYTSVAIPWGIQVGGIEYNRFEKDLTLAPRHDARGRRFDLADNELLLSALELDRYLERHASYSHLPRQRQPRWPNLWAAFEPSTARHIRYAGPELEAVKLRGAATKSQSCIGLTLFPLELVSHAWRQFIRVFADLKSIPKRHVVALDHAAHNLCGFDGAIEFDLRHSRFSSQTV